MDKERYSRNIVIDGFGEEGQQLLSAAKVLVIGAGGLGSSVLYYLAAAGIGTLGIVDYDVVDLSNLQRQILHTTNDVGRLKALSAEEKLRALNPDIAIQTYMVRFEKDNALALIAPYDLIVDCSDSYETKYLINDCCVEAQKPYVHGAVIGLKGEVMTYLPGCADYRSVFPAPPPSDGKASNKSIGTLGAVAGIVGSIQATEVVKYFTGIGTLITNRLLVIDAKDMSTHSLKIAR